MNLTNCVGALIRGESASVALHLTVIWAASAENSAKLQHCLALACTSLGKLLEVQLVGGYDRDESKVLDGLVAFQRKALHGASPIPREHKAQVRYLESINCTKATVSPAALAAFVTSYTPSSTNWSELVSKEVWKFAKNQQVVCCHTTKTKRCVSWSTKTCLITAMTPRCIETREVLARDATSEQAFVEAKLSPRALRVFRYGPVYPDSFDVCVLREILSCVGCGHISRTACRCTRSSWVACACCGAIAPSLSRCGRCKRVTFCSRDCQKKKWKSHKAQCRP